MPRSGKRCKDRLRARVSGKRRDRRRLRRLTAHRLDDQLQALFSQLSIVDDEKHQKLQRLLSNFDANKAVRFSNLYDSDNDSDLDLATLNSRNNFGCNVHPTMFKKNLHGSDSGSGTCHNNPTVFCLNGQSLSLNSACGESAATGKNSPTSVSTSPAQGPTKQTHCSAFQQRQPTLAKPVTRGMLPPGLRNLGNTCFANSLLQCLALLEPFVKTVTSYATARTCGPKASLASQLCSVLSLTFCNLRQSNTPIATPRELVDFFPKFGCSAVTGLPRFQVGQQQDPAELLDAIIGLLNCESFFMSAISFKYAAVLKVLSVFCFAAAPLEGTPITSVHNYFGGKSCQTTTCGTCKTSSPVDDTFQVLCLDISDSSVVDIDSAFHHTNQSETLTGQNKFHCSRCARKVPIATRAYSVTTSPPCLWIQLNRFTSDLFGNVTQKVQKSVAFGEHFVLPLASGESSSYRLQAVIDHIGSTPTSGHYVANIRKPGPSNHVSSEWLKMDDSQVSSLPANSVLGNPHAHMLMFVHETTSAYLSTQVLSLSLTNKTGLKGLHNLGHSSFVNAVLQCFATVPPLLQAIQNASKCIQLEEKSFGRALVTSLLSIFSEMSSTTTDASSPALLCDLLPYFVLSDQTYTEPSFKLGTPGDATQFFHALIDKLAGKCLSTYVPICQFFPHVRLE